MGSECLDDIRRRSHGVHADDKLCRDCCWYDLDTLSQDGSTALICASKEGDIAVVQALLAAGAEKDAKKRVLVWGGVKA